MIYHPTTLLPPSPLFSSVDEAIVSLCDECLVITYSDIRVPDKIQAFEYTMKIIDFWEDVRKMEELMWKSIKET